MEDCAPNFHLIGVMLSSEGLAVVDYSGPVVPSFLGKDSLPYLWVVEGHVIMLGVLGLVPHWLWGES